MSKIGIAFMHDHNGSVGGISTRVSFILKENKDLPEETRKYLEDIQSYCKDLSKLADGFYQHENTLLDRLYEEIKHGDAEHQKWLKDSIEEFKNPKKIKVKCINILPLKGNDIAPPLEEGKEYIIKNMFIDSGGNKHYDVGLESKHQFITSYETKERLPNGDKIHWCHPSRFEII